MSECVCVLSRVQRTLRTIARQVPLSMGFLGKNTGVGFHFFLQGIFLTQGVNPYHLDVLHQQEISSHSVTWESSRKYKRFKNIKGLKRSVVAMGFKGGTMNILSLENFQDHEIICGKLL